MTTPPCFSKFDAWQMGKLHLAASLHYEIAAKWKIIFQNYSGMLPLPNRSSGTQSAVSIQVRPERPACRCFPGGPMTLADNMETMSKDGQSIANRISGLTSPLPSRGSYYTIFPTMSSGPHPDYVMVHRLVRIDVDRTGIWCEFLLEDEVPDAERLAQAVGFWDETNRQDWHVCERVQSGSNSPGFQPAVYSSLESVLPNLTATIARSWATFPNGQA